MAEINNTEEFQTTLTNINEALTSLRAQTVLNAGDIGKSLGDISLKLSNLAESEDEDLIKAFLAEMKRTMDERHNYVQVEFENIAETFNAIKEKADDSLKSEDVKQLFDIIATNLNVFSKEVVQQKDTLASIVTQIDTLQNDDSQKQDIIRNISSLRGDFDKFNNGFQSIVLSLNDNFKSLNTYLQDNNQTENMAGLKKDMDNIFLSTNAVLSAIKVIDHKNRELENVITNVVTKDEFAVTKDFLTSIVSNTEKLANNIEILPKQNLIEDLGQRVDTSIGVIAGLKTILTQESENGTKAIIEQLDRLDDAVNQIITEEDFRLFRESLENLINDIIQNTNLMRGDLLETNSELKNVLSLLSSLNFKTNFQQIFSLISHTEDSVKASVYALNDDFTKKVQSDSEFANELGEKLAAIKSELLNTREALTNDSSANVGTLVSNIEDVTTKIDILDRNFGNKSTENLTLLKATMSEILTRLNAVNDELKDNSDDKLNSISIIFTGLSNKIADFNSDLVEYVQTNKDNFNELSQKLDNTKNALVANSEENRDSILRNIQPLITIIDEVKTEVTSGSVQSLSLLDSKLQTFSEDLDSTRNTLLVGSGTNFEKLSSLINDVTTKITELKDNYNHNSIENFESLTNSLSEIQNLFRGLGEEIKEKADNNFSNLKNDLVDLKDEFSSTKDELKSSLSNTSANLQNITEANNEKVIDVLKNELSGLSEKLSILDSRENVQNVVENIKTLVGEFDSFRGDIRTDSLQNITKIVEEVSGMNVELSHTREVLAHSASENYNNIVEEIEKVTEGLNLTVEQIKNTANVNVETISTSLKEIFEKLNLVSGELKQKSAENVEKITGDVSLLESRMGQIDENIKNTLDEKSSEYTLVLQEMAAKFSSNTDETKQKLTENYEDLTLGIKAVSDKLGEVDAEVKAAFDIATEKVLGQVRDVVTRFDGVNEAINTQTEGVNTIVAEKIAAVVELINSIKSTLGFKLDNNFATIGVNFDNLDEKISGIAHNVETVTFNAVEKVREQIGEIVQKLDDSKEYLDDKAQGNYFSLIGTLNELSQKLTVVNDKVSLYSEDNFDNILSNITKVSAALAEVNEKSNFDFVSDIKKLGDDVKALPEIIKSNQKATEDEARLLMEQNASSLLSLTDKIHQLTSNITTREKNVTDSFEGQIQTLKEALEVVKSDLNSSTESAGKDLRLKIETIESMISMNASNYGIDLNNAKSDLTEVLNAIKTVQNEASEKISNSIDEVAEVKTDVQTVIEQVNAICEKQNTNFNGIQDEIKSSIDEVLKNITILQGFTQNSDDGAVKSAFATLDGKLEDLISKLEELNLKSDSTSESLIKSVQERAESIKTQIDLINTDVIEAMTAKSSAISEEVALAKETLSDLLNSNISKVADDVKSDIEIANASLIALLKENSSENKEQIVSDLAQNFASLKENLNEVDEKFSKRSSENLIEIKDLLLQVISEIQNKKDNTDELKDAIKLEGENQMSFLKLQIDSLTGKFERITNSIDGLKDLSLAKEEKTEEPLNIKPALADLKGDLSVEFAENFEALKQNFNGVVSEVKEKIETSQTAYGESVTGLLTDIKQSVQERLEDSFDEMKSFLEVSNNNATLVDEIDRLKGEVAEKIEDVQYNLEKLVDNASDRFDKSELVEEIKSVVEQVVDSSLASLNSSSSGKELSELLEKDNNILINLDKMKEELSDEIYEKSELFSQNLETQKSEFETLKSDLQETMNGIKEEFGEISISANSEISMMLADMQETIKSFQPSLDKSNEIMDVAINSNAEIASSLVELSDTVKKVQENISSIEPSLDEKTGDLMNLAINTNAELTGLLEELKTSVEDLKPTEEQINMDKLVKGSYLKISDEIQEIKECFENIDLKPTSSVVEGVEKISKQLEEFDFKGIMAAQNNVILKEIVGLQNDIKAIKLDEGISDSLELINQKLDVLALSDNTEVEESIEDIKQFMAEQKEFLNNIENILKPQEIDMDKFQDFLRDSEFENATQELKDILDGFNNRLDEIGKKEEFGYLHERFDTLSNETLPDIKAEFGYLHQRFDKLDNESIPAVDEKFKNLDKKFEEQNNGTVYEMKEQFDNLHRELDTLNNDTVFKLTEEIRKFDISENKKEFDYLHERFDTVNEAQEKVSERLDAMNTEQFSFMHQRLDNLTNEQIPSINTKIGELATQEELNEIKSKLSSLDNVEILDAIREQLVALDTDNVGRFDELKDRLYDLDNTKVLIEIKELLSNLNGTDDLTEIKELLSKWNSSEDISNLSDSLDKKIEELKNETSEQMFAIHEKLSEISENSTGSNVAEQLDILYNTDYTSTFENIKKEINTVKGTLVDTIMNVFEQVSFAVEAEEIKDFVEAKTKEIKSDVTSEISSDIETAMVNVKSEVQAQADRLTEIIDANTKDLDENVNQLSVDVNNKLAKNKDFLVDNFAIVNDNIDVLDKHIGTLDTTDNFNHVFDELEKLQDRTKDVDGNCDDIKENIVVLQNQLKQIKSNDEDEDYNYSMQDIETDIAKLRVVLDNMQKSTSTSSDIEEVSQNIFEIARSIDSLEQSMSEDKSIEKVNEEVMSISTRTNQLLLNSEEANKTLQEKLDEFKGVVTSIDERAKFIDNRGIDRKLDNINNMVISGLKSDKVLSQAFIQLGEWIDAAGESIDAISDKVGEIDDVKKTLSTLKTKSPDNSDLIDALEAKFVKQQNRIDALEEKLDQVLDTISEQDNTKIAKKVDSIDKHLVKLSKSIEKLTSYVDEA